MDKNKVDITIGAQSLTVVSGEAPAYVKKLADGINKRIAAVMKSSQRINVNEALAVISMDLADELWKSEEQTKKLRDEISDYLKDAEDAKLERDRYLHELKLLKK